MSRPIPAIPIWLKLAVPAFLCVLMPIYWREYGPSNFLWFSDIALGFTAIAVIFDLPIFACMVAVGFLPLELAWCLDFATGSKRPRRLHVRRPLLAVPARALAVPSGDTADDDNWAFGPGSEPQHWIDPWAYFAVVLATWSPLVLVPMRLLLRRLFPPAPMGA
jgi:hypothetical protein